MKTIQLTQQQLDELCFSLLHDTQRKIRSASGELAFEQGRRKLLEAQKTKSC